MAFNEKRVSAITLSALTAAMLTFSGCGGGGSSSDGGDDIVTPPDDNTTLTKLYYDGAGAADAEARHTANDADAAAQLPEVPAYDAAIVDNTTLVGAITTAVHLTADKQWEVTGLVTVKDGGSLEIDPGTVVFGKEGENYIVVTKSGTISANGTVEQPIIFTSEIALKNPSAADKGQWGGLTVLGEAPTNHDDQDPHYEVDENNPDFAFGGAVADDNSGVLRNLYILNSGKTIGTDLEINGLSLAGVGSGTTVENITVVNSADDCIEIWGGTVNVTNATMINCQDDSFDLDYGYTGTATNIFVQQKGIAHAGFEISSGGDTPMTSAKIVNFSINKVEGSDEGGIYVKDDTTAPTFVNGVVSTLGETDADIHTKKAFTAEQKAAIAFKDVTLK
jgi:hypothetical protein